MATAAPSASWLDGFDPSVFQSQDPNAAAPVASVPIGPPAPQPVLLAPMHPGPRLGGPHLGGPRLATPHLGGPHPATFLAPRPDVEGPEAPGRFAPVKDKSDFNKMIEDEWKAQTEADKVRKEHAQEAQLAGADDQTEVDAVARSQGVDPESFKTQPLFSMLDLDPLAEATGTAKEETKGGAPIFAKGAGAPARVAGGLGVGGGAGSASLAMSSQTPGEAGPGGDFDAPYNDAMAALKAKSAAQGDIATAEGDAAKQKELAGNKAAADYDAAQHKYQELQDLHYARLDELNKQVAEGTVDPDRWWNNQGLGRQIMYGLAAALGGFASGYRNVPNTAMQIIKSHIDNDIDAQKANLEGKRHAAEGERGLLAEAYQRTHNMQEAISLAKSAAYDQVDNQLRQVTAGSNSAVAKANADLLGADVNKWRQEEKEKNAEYFSGLASKQMIAEMRKLKGAGAGGVPQKEVDAYGKSLEAKNIPATRAALDNFMATLQAGGEAGLGRVTTAFANHVTDAGLSDEGKTTRAALQELNAEVTKGLGRLSPATMKLVQQVTSSGDPALVKQYVAHVQARLNAEENANAARFPPGVKQVYDERYGALQGAEPTSGRDVPEGAETP